MKAEPVSGTFEREPAAALSAAGSARALVPTLPRVLTRALVLVALAVSLSSAAANSFYRYQELRAEADRMYAPYLVQLGLTPTFFIVYFLGIEVVIALAYASLGLLIAWRGPATRIGTFTAVALMLYGVTLPPPMHALVVNLPQLPPLLNLERGVGLALFVILFYIFPDGKFVPRWSLGFAVVLGAWSLIWPFYPPANPYLWPGAAPFLVLAALFATGASAQLYRYYRVASPLQRQQTKWVVFGLTVSVAGDFITHAPWVFLPLRHGPDLPLLLIHHPFFAISQLLVPLTIAFSVLRYGLWEIDFILNRTLVYGLMTSFLAVVAASTIKAAEVAFGAIFGFGAGAQVVATGAAVLVTGVLFRPAYARFESLVDERLKPHSFDFGRELIELAPDVRHTIPLDHMLRALVVRTIELVDAPYGAVFFFEPDGRAAMVEDCAAPKSIPDWSQPELAEIQAGRVVKRSPDDDFQLLVPLLVPRGRPDVLGFLGLGPRREGKGYSSQELADLAALGSHAGVALYLARLRASSGGR